MWGHTPHPARNRRSRRSAQDSPSPSVHKLRNSGEAATRNQGGEASLSPVSNDASAPCRVPWWSVCSGRRDIFRCSPSRARPSRRSAFSSVCICCTPQRWLWSSPGCTTRPTEASSSASSPTARPMRPPFAGYPIAGMASQLILAATAWLLALAVVIFSGHRSLGAPQPPGPHSLAAHA
jgi:hypothetical protein